MSRLSETIEEDGVAMRWLRTAATTVISVGGALAILWGAVVFVFGPRINDWAVDMIRETTVELRREVEETSRNVADLGDIVGDLTSVVATMREDQAAQEAPAWRWSRPDTSIGDGIVGGVIEIQAAGYKLRECGAPVVDLYFVNGNDLFHRFEDVSITGPDGRGVVLPVAPDRVQHVNFTARIPADEGVMMGRAQGYITVSYPDMCPNARAETIGPMQFRIRDGTGGETQL